MEPIYENIQPNINSSFYSFMESPGCCEPFWHIHPEYELVYIHSGSNERHIGSNITRYTNGDLLLIGSNIPHSNLGNVDDAHNKEVVIQMSEDFVDNQLGGFVEFNEISDLFKRSLHGISFHARVKEKVGPMLMQLVQYKSFEKLLKLIEILGLLASTQDYTLLHTNTASLHIQSNDFNRVNRINNFVSEHYSRNIPLKELADLTGLTETSFSRFFKKVTGKTFITFLNEYRIQKACTFLAKSNSNISEVMMKSGFVEPAHFTRVFKRYTSYTPRDYKKKIRTKEL
ncbi:helix-turn-helix domain-containing protein [Labilibacter marinus]|uniref:helix-turn-helix domain-containing protein n=1 Tax=Labilibacter marinus TaxID=1477105 RepID=UPI0009502A5A|nr:AraC family transcriptional regulator [Labilibacter marinus]